MPGQAPVHCARDMRYNHRTNFRILIDSGSTTSFIYSSTLKRIKVKVEENDKFIYIEMASGAKKKVRGKVIDCSIDLGDFVIKVRLYIMILGSYDIVIGMD
jgi:hypothetical protein